MASLAWNHMPDVDYIYSKYSYTLPKKSQLGDDITTKATNLSFETYIIYFDD